MTLAITIHELPYGRVNSWYQARLTCVGAGPGNPLWTITSGSLPPGLQLTGDGQIFGMPTAETVNGTFRVLVQDPVTGQNAAAAMGLNILDALIPDPGNVHAQFRNADF